MAGEKIHSGPKIERFQRHVIIDYSQGVQLHKKCGRAHFRERRGLVRLAYRVTKYGEAYMDKGREFYKQNYRDQQVRMLSRKVEELGMEPTLRAGSSGGEHGRVRKLRRQAPARTKSRFEFL